ncbi:MAG: four helix bundle protein, partial [Brevundimonas sp.]
FVGVARGSLAEAETQLILALRLNYIPEPDARALLGGSDEISKMLAALAASLARRREG